jgi:hypothetical protein
MLGVISRGEATFSLDANRHVMNQRRRLAITNSLPVTENWTRVAQMAHFVAIMSDYGSCRIDAHRCCPGLPAGDRKSLYGREGALSSLRCNRQYAYVFSYCALAEDRERATSMNSALPI